MSIPRPEICEPTTSNNNPNSARTCVCVWVRADATLLLQKMFAHFNFGAGAACQRSAGA